MFQLSEKGNTRLSVIRQQEHSMREIDLATWNRVMHFQVFRNSVQPQYCVTFELDITNFLQRIKERGVFLHIFFCICSDKVC